MWKIPTRRKDSVRLETMSLLTEVVKNEFGQYMLIDVKRWQHIRTTSDYFSGRGWFYYTKIKHNPMTPNEAAGCLGHFMRELCGTLCILHDKDFAHLDLRLENICFDDNDKLVLVDLDRCTSTSNFSDADGTSALSVMYFNMETAPTAIMTDWRQVGLMI